MAESPLRHLADVDEIDINSRRRDGSSKATTVWVVRVGDDVFVRSMYGPGSGWYRRLRANPDAEVRDDGHEHPVHAEPVGDERTVGEVTRAYASKYSNSPYVDALLNDRAASATLRLQPR
jgi:hypothetical protein